VSFLFFNSIAVNKKGKRGKFHFFTKILKETKRKIKGFREELREIHTHTSKHLIKRER
jgi:hypothetical protein